MRLIGIGLALAMIAAACAPASDGTPGTREGFKDGIPDHLPKTVFGQAAALGWGDVPSNEHTRAKAAEQIVRDCDVYGGFSTLCDTFLMLAVNSPPFDITDQERLVEIALRGLHELLANEKGSEPPTAGDCPLFTVAFRVICAEAHKVATETGASFAQVSDAISRGLVEFGIDEHSGERPIYRLDNGAYHYGLGATYDLVREAEDGSRFRCDQISDDCRMVITALQADEPAALAGLRVGDAIAAIDNQELDGHTLLEALDILWDFSEFSTVDEPIQYTVTRAGDTFDINLTRAMIFYTAMESRLVTESIGYVRLSRIGFTGTETAVAGVLEELQSDGAETVILDLQGNRGGIINTAYAVLGLFVGRTDGAQIVQLSQCAGRSPTECLQSREVAARIEPTPFRVSQAVSSDVRVIVLVDGDTASSAELLAGRLQEEGRAVIIGETTAGKSALQWPVFRRDMLFTVAHWELLDGTNIAGIGITPDVPIEIPEGSHVDYLLEQTIEYIKANP